MHRVLLFATALSATLVAASLPLKKGQVPQFGNGYVATFVNSDSEYVAGVFSGPGDTSTRAALPATTRFLAGPCAAALTAEFPFNLTVETATVSLQCANGVSQEWGTPTAPCQASAWSASQLGRRLSRLPTTTQPTGVAFPS